VLFDSEFGVNKLLCEISQFAGAWLSVNGNDQNLNNPVAEEKEEYDGEIDTCIFCNIA